MSNKYKYDFSGLMDDEQEEKPYDNKYGYAATQERIGEAEERIAERGNLWGQIKEDVQSGKTGRVIKGALEVTGAPLQMIESAVANPMIEMQKGVPSIPKLIKSVGEGFVGRRQGEIGDVLKTGATMGEADWAADTAAVGMTIGGGAKIFNTIMKPFKTISKVSDAGINTAGKKLVQATDDASGFIRDKLNDAFKVADDVNIDQNQLLEIVTKLPKPLINAIEESIGKITDFGKMTIGQLRHIKRVVGKFNPSAFGKAERGLQENIDADKINKAYSSLKKLLESSVTQQLGKTAAKKLLQIEETMTNAIRAGNVIKKSVVDPTLRMSTKGGRVASGIIRQGDTTMRTALNILRKDGKEAMKNIDEAVRLLNSYNRWRIAGKVGQRIGQAAMTGGAIRALMPRGRDGDQGGGSSPPIPNTSG